MKKKTLCLIFALLLGLSVLLIGCKKDTPVQGSFVRPAFDANAVAGTPTVPAGMGYGEIDAKGAYTVGVCGEINIVDGKADVYFTNVASNGVLLKLRVQDQKSGEVYGETGLIKPGEYVQSVAFSKVPYKGTDITLRVMSYQPDTYYSEGEVKMNTVVAQGPTNLVWVGIVGGVLTLILGAYTVHLILAKKKEDDKKASAHAGKKKHSASTKRI